MESYFAQRREKVRIQQQKRAEAHGFSTFAEYQKFDMRRYDESLARYNASLDEKCKILGKTREELDAEDPQRLIVPDRPECNCEGHIIPFFCPQILLSYKSMAEEDPSGLLRYTHPQNIKQLHMNEDDTSKRLCEDDLGRYWRVDSQKVPLKLPQWAARDPVIKQIAASAIEHPSLLPNCTPESSVFKCPRFTSPAQQTTEQSSISKVTSKDSMGYVQQLPEPTFKPSPKALSQTMRKSKSQTTKVNISRQTLPSGIKKRVSKVTSRTQKLPSHTMQTRSQDSLTFYALDVCNGTTSFRKPRRSRTKGEKADLL